MERTDAEVVAREQQHTAACIGDGERELPVQALDARGAMPVVGLQNDVRVCVVCGRRQIGPIEKAPVPGDAQRSIRHRHGSVSAGLERDLPGGTEKRAADPGREFRLTCHRGDHRRKARCKSSSVSRYIDTFHTHSASAC